MNERVRGRVLRWLGRLALGLGSLLLLVTVLWLHGEWRWSRWELLSPADAFRSGPIGLELAPLSYVLVMDEVSADAFRTGSEGGRGLWETYGFLPNPAAATSDDPRDQLPVGFTVSQRVPLTAAANPVEFVGLGCAACHSTRLRKPSGEFTPILYGAGSSGLDVIAWSEAFVQAVLDPELTVDRIFEAYDARFPGPRGMLERVVSRPLERLVVGEWLAQAREALGGGVGKYDLPFSGSALKDAHSIPAGPGRTRPFRSVVRVALDLPAADNDAFSKIPAVFDQSPTLRPRSQYDGSIGNPVTRAFVAAYASGASVESLSKPEVVHNIRAAAGYTEHLGGSVAVPAFAELFPEHLPDRERTQSGFGVYMQYCNRCHGHRPLDGGPWSLDGATDVHAVSPLEEIGTDPERIRFRHAEKVPLALWTAIPGRGDDLEQQKQALREASASARADGRPAEAWMWDERLESLVHLSGRYRVGHPFYFERNELSQEAGYVNNPIPRAFLRAPYLHNGSVPTLRQLIQLDRRPDSFLRGSNTYDPAALGLVAPEPDSASGDSALSFVFDTRARGNSNKGHEYPWPYDDPDRDPVALKNLLEYLKTL